MKKNYSTLSFLTKVLFLSVCLGVSACTNSAGKGGIDLIPSKINDTAIKSITGYDSMDKKEIENHVSKSISNEQTYGDDEKAIVNEFLDQVNSYVNLTVIGDNFDVIDHQNNSGVPFSGTTIGFTFLQNVSTSFKCRDKTIEIAVGEDKKVGDYSFASPFNNGALIIMKSLDNTTWQQETVVVSTNRFYVSYFPNSSDVLNGAYYRFVNIVHFRFYSHTETKSSGILWWKKTWEEDVYATFNVIQQFNVVVAKNSVDIRFSCENMDSHTISSEDLSEGEIELLQKSTTMTNGSVSTSYIKAEVSSSTNSIQYTYLGENGSHSGSLTQTTTFTNPGKYTFKITTFFGNVTNITLYIVHLGEDNGKSLFFGDGLVDSSMRVFDPTKVVQTYMIGKSYNLISLPEYMPGRYGAIYYFKDETSIKNQTGQIIKSFEDSRDNYVGNFTMQGYYIFDIYNCDLETASGDVFNYRFTYNLVNNPLYAPFVNYGLITNPGRSCLLATKVLVVSLPTAGGGYYQFIYPYTESYLQKAYEAAVEIEELNVEIVNQNGTKHYFYKSMANSNLKTDYSGKLALYEAINYYAKQNINVTYLDNSVPFAESLLDEELKDISKSSISHTVRVVEDQQALSDLRTGDIYLNNYVFTQVADFEVDSISATGENGHVYDVQFDHELDSLFSKSDKVTIKEHNWNRETIYQTIYSKSNTCELTLSINSIEQTVTKNNNNANYTVSSFKFISANDKYDSQTLISIDDGNTRSLFSMNEISGLSLPKGQYVITIINRNNQTYSFNVNRTEDLQNNEESYSNYNRNPLANDILDLSVEAPKDDSAIETIPVTIMTLVLIVFITILITSAITFFPTFFGTRAALLHKAKNEEVVVEKSNEVVSESVESEETEEQPIEKAEESDGAKKEESE